ncbi:MAG: hypothetical protein ABFC67_14550 [Mizugakiibacter sp.]|uniref:hypothetical protein n=1 Tax=Mizugakiibacter sp. TaxID=1972610 RepID=UPI0032118804
MYAALIKANVDSRGLDLSGDVVPMLAGTTHLVSMNDVNFFKSHPDVFSVLQENVTPVLLDASGNVTANINLRTDTLANLLALASGGGTSEVGYDPATHTLVFFNGVPGEAKASGREIVIARMICPTSATGLDGTGTPGTAPTVWKPITINNASSLIDDGILDVANPTEMVWPANANAVRIKHSGRFAANASGVYRMLRLEGYSAGLWTSLLACPNAGNYMGGLTTAQAQPITFIGTVKPGVLPSRIRLVATTDAGAVVSYMASLSPLDIEFLAL